MNSHLNRIQWIKIIFICFGFLMNPALLASDHKSIMHYQWGRGLTIPSMDLTLGGYSGISFEDYESDSNNASLDDISFFISWSPTARIRFFSELEMENLISSQGISSFSESFSLERLYVDFLVTDSFTLRLGQFLTPVGRWNTLHASPLVWTTSRPLVTESHFFPSRTNGAMLKQQWFINGNDLDVSIYIDDSKHLDPRQLNHHYNTNSEAAFKYAIGTSIRYKVTHELNFGFSYLSFETRLEEKSSLNHLMGIDLLWQKKGYEIQVEWAYHYKNRQQGDTISGYIQGVIPLTDEFFIVGRYELFTGQYLNFLEKFEGTSHLAIPALVWRPFFPLVLKAEYRFGDNNQQLAPSGFFSSISVLF
jgi:hypothetical protein